MHHPPPSTLPPGSLVDSYRRDSGGMRQDQSTDQQLAEIERFCEQNNLIHRHRFVDEARSGGTTAGRDDFNRMLDLYASQPDQRPRGLLLWNYARFARDIDDAQFNKIRIRQWGIAVFSLTDSVPEGDHGRIIEFLIDVANEEKRKQTSADARRGLKDLVLRHGCVPGIPPRGFKRQPVHIGLRRDKTEHIAHRWVPDPDLVPIIQQAFQLKAARATAEHIHTETLLFRSLNSYSTFWTNELYIGTLRFGDLTIENYCPPIVDIQIWNDVQEIVRDNAQRHNRSADHPRRNLASYLLSGLVHCARCGSPLWGMTSGQRSGKPYYRYACTRAKRNRDCDFPPIPAAPLEKHVISALRLFAMEPSNMQALLDADQTDNAALLAGNQAKIKQHQKELSVISRRVKNTASALSKRPQSAALLKQLDELETEQTRLQSKLHQLKSATPEPEPPLTPEAVRQASQYLSQVLQTTDPAELRRGLQALTRTIIVDRRDREVFGVIRFKKKHREPRDDEESPATSGIITASIQLPPVGALIKKTRREACFCFYDRRPH